MKQTLNPWTKLLMLMLLTASAIVLFTVTALAKSPASTLASDDSVHAPPVPTPPPSEIYISTSHNAKIDVGESNNPAVFRFKREDILRCVIGPNGKCTWDVRLDTTTIGLSGVNIRDFEFLPNQDLLFVIDRKKTLPGGIQATPHDVIRYSTTGVFSFELVGSTIGLTKSNENIDALAVTPPPNPNPDALQYGHLIISTFGSASVNGIADKVQDEDLLEIDGATASVYFDGTAVGLTKSSEDISSAWIGYPSPDHNIYLVTKGNFSVNSVNSLSGKKSDIFGCSPTSQNPIQSCFFYSFFIGETSGLDNQIDGISVVTMGPIANIAVSAAVQGVLNSVVDENVDNSFDAESFADAMSEGDPEITAEDFIDVSARLYLPMVARR
ncbi:hypothetical protein BH10CHL1_BH10CHL1_06990 [soil metagenome]